MRKTKNFVGLVCLLLTGLTAGYAGSLTNQASYALREKVAGVYTSQIGVRELSGRNDGAEVEKYLASTGLGKGYPWCAAFVAWCFDEAGVHAIHSAWSPSWFPRSATIYTKGRRDNQNPERADVFGIFYRHLDRIGHIGFIHDWPAGSDYVITVEGNTNNAGSREGDGVYKKRRVKRNIYKVSRWV